jgi:hypothetical protein
MRLNSCARILCRAERHDWLKVVWQWLLPLVCQLFAPRPLCRPRESEVTGRAAAARSRSCCCRYTVTADHDRTKPIGGVVIATANGGVLAAGGVVAAAAHAGEETAGSISKSATDAGRNAADAGVGAAGEVSDAAANAGEKEHERYVTRLGNLTLSR